MEIIERERMMQVDNRFEIGEILKSNMDHKNQNPLHVIEIETLTCPAGTQIYYICRGHSRFRDQYGFTPNTLKLNEIELEKWPEDSEWK